MNRCIQGWLIASNDPSFHSTQSSFLSICYIVVDLFAVWIYFVLKVGSSGSTNSDPLTLERLEAARAAVSTTAGSCWCSLCNTAIRIIFRLGSFLAATSSALAHAEVSTLTVHVEKHTLELSVRIKA